MAEEKVIKSSTSISKADFIYEDTEEHKLGKTHKVCKVCHTKTKYLRNTANLR